MVVTNIEMKKSWISLFFLICIYIYNFADPYFANLHSESNNGGCYSYIKLRLF